MTPDFSLFNCSEPTCSGHLAGWYWAQERNITDSSQCSGDGSFLDGCLVYVTQVSGTTDTQASNSTDTSGQTLLS